MSVSYLDRQVLSVLAPTVTDALGLSETQYGLLAAAFAFAYLAGAPVAGAWLDRFGARRGLALALLAWSAVSASHTLVTGFGSLVALRVLLGLAEAPSFPGAMQTIQRALPAGGARTRAVGLLFTGSSFGAVAAPLVANAFDRAFGWRFAFVGSALVGLAWLPAWLLFTGGAARAALAAAPAAPAAVVRPVWSSRAVWRAFAASFAISPVLGFALLWLSKFLAAAHGLSPAQAAPYLFLPPLFFDLGSVLFGQFTARSPRAAHTYFGAAAVLASLMGALPFLPSPAAVSVACSLSLAGAGGVLAINTAQLIGAVPGSSVSSAGGIVVAAQSLALIVANPLIGRSIDVTGSYVPALLSLGALSLFGAGLWLSLPPRADVAAGPSGPYRGGPELGAARGRRGAQGDERDVGRGVGPYGQFGRADAARDEDPSAVDAEQAEGQTAAEGARRQHDRPRARQGDLAAVGVAGEEQLDGRRAREGEAVGRVAERDREAGPRARGEAGGGVGGARPRVVEPEHGDVVVGRGQARRLVDEHPRAGAGERALEPPVRRPQVVVAEDRQLHRRAQGRDARLELVGARPGGVEKDVIAAEEHDVGRARGDEVEGPVERRAGRRRPQVQIGQERHAQRRALAAGRQQRQGVFDEAHVARAGPQAPEPSGPVERGVGEAKGGL
jgi:ACS family hexuronate transporter-like MFS transporter